MSEDYTDEQLLELFDEDTVGQLEGSNDNFRALRRAYKQLHKETKELRKEVEHGRVQLRSDALERAGFDPESRQADALIGIATEDPDADPYAPGTYQEIAEAIGMKPVAPQPAEPSDEYDDEEE